MLSKISRRKFVGNTAAVSLCSLIPRASDESFRYIDVAAGDGSLDAMLLDRFPRAEATLLDGSPVMVKIERSPLTECRPSCSPVWPARPPVTGWRPAASACWSIGRLMVMLRSLSSRAASMQMMKAPRTTRGR